MHLAYYIFLITFLFDCQWIQYLIIFHQAEGRHRCREPDIICLRHRWRWYWWSKNLLLSHNLCPTDLTKDLYCSLHFLRNQNYTSWIHNSCLISFLSLKSRISLWSKTVKKQKKHWKNWGKLSNKLKKKCKSFLKEQTHVMCRFQVFYFCNMLPAMSHMHCIGEHMVQSICCRQCHIVSMPLHQQSL